MNNTALGAENKKEQTINFISEAHEKFYYEKLKEVRYQDVYHKTWICLLLASLMICMLKTATMIIKDIRKWRLRRTSTNFNQLVDFGV